MIGPESITLGLAFLAGLASFLSPCVLALVPIYVGYLGGRSVGKEPSSRWATFTHGVAFVVGFSLVFVALGVAVSALGALFYDIREWLERVGGVVGLLFGLHIMGVIRIPVLNWDKRFHLELNRRVGYLPSFLMGVFFSAGWTPCVGPVLGAVLMMALGAGEVTRGAVLLSAYSAGMAVPFLATALGIGWASGMMRRFGKTIRIIEVATGVLLTVVGILMILGIMGKVFAQWAGLGFFIELGL